MKKEEKKWKEEGKMKEKNNKQQHSHLSKSLTTFRMSRSVLLSIPLSLEELSS